LCVTKKLLPEETVSGLELESSKTRNWLCMLKP